MEEALGLSGIHAMLYGALGGLLIGFLDMYKIRHSFGSLPDKHFVKSYGYWFCSVGSVFVGGLVAYLLAEFTDSNINEIVSIQIGFSWPLLLEKLASETPSVDLGNIG